MEVYDKYIGQVLDNRYRVTKRIGTGGMSVVFEATDLVMKRIVAIKILRDEVSNDPQAVKRFVNESKAVAMLNHPNIVSIYDVSVKENLKYIVMEHVDGITLKNYINRKGALSCREALHYTNQILSALEHAHSKGVVHRDIKPQNVMLLKNGVIKVTDFGIAKLPNAETISSPDKAIGTVYYISPEQASGKQIDQRSDLYSLGVMLYEMVTGVLPFRADTPVSVALKQINEQPRRPRDYVKDIPEGVEQIILTAMEKSPEKRFQNATQMRRYIAKVLENPAVVFKYRKKNETPDKYYNGKKKKQNKKDNEEKSSSMLPMIAGIVIAVFIIIGISAYFIISNYFAQQEQQSHEIVVGKYVGEIFTDDMKKELEKTGFNVKVKYINDESPEGTIITQSPKEGEKRKTLSGTQGADLNLTVSLGKETFKISDYSSMDYRNVENDLKKKGVLIKREYEESELVPENLVIRTNPIANSNVSKGDTVTIIISSGVKFKAVAVPEFKTKTYEEINELLGEFKLVLGNITLKTSDAPKDTVIEQTPTAGTVVAEGTAIDFIVSKGPEETEKKDEVEVPEMKGKSFDEASEMLDKLGLVVDIQWISDDNIGMGMFIKSNPVAGTKLKKGSTVTIYISIGGDLKPETQETTSTSTSSPETKKTPEETKAPETTQTDDNQKKTQPD